MRVLSRRTAVSTVSAVENHHLDDFIRRQRIDVAAPRIHGLCRKMLPLRSCRHSFDLNLKHIFSARFKECFSAVLAPRHLRHDGRKCNVGTPSWRPTISPTLSQRSQAILRKVLRGNNGICSRSSGVRSSERSVRFRPGRARRTVCQARTGGRVATPPRARSTRAGRRPGDIDAVIISTCTGYLCPGLTSYVTERLGLPTDILALDLVGQGCGAALPNMRAGEALIAGGRARRVLSICVEICSAAMYLDDDPGVLISACLFGDGAGAAVLTAEPMPGRRRIEWKSAGTLMNAGRSRRASVRAARRHAAQHPDARGSRRSPRSMSIGCSPKGWIATGLSRGDITGGSSMPAAARFSPLFASSRADRRRHAMERGDSARLRQLSAARASTSCSRRR